MIPAGLLLDMGISPKVSHALQQQGIEVFHVLDLGMATAEDTAIIDRARSANLVIVTSDSDFSRLVTLSKLSSPSVITLRLHNPTAEEQEAALLSLLAKESLESLQGHLVSVERGRYRKRSLPL